MVAPLNVEIVVACQGVHNLPGTGTTIEDVANDVEGIDDEAVDEIADGDDESLAASHFDHRVDNSVVVVLSVGFGLGLVEKLGDDVGEFRIEKLLEFRASIFVIDKTSKFDQLMDGHTIPVIKVFGVLLALDELEFLFGIIDEGA